MSRCPQSRVLTELVKEQIRAAYTAIIGALSLTSRPGQRQMIASIAQALARVGTADPAICLVEAGTGTGKTLAYAISAIPLAQAMGKRLVIATATINLQEQLLRKDLPALREHSGLSFDVALAKGRRRYVCLARLEQLLQDGVELPLGFFPDDPGMSLRLSMPLYQRMLDALAAGRWSGDRDQWQESLEERQWLPATADRNQCSGRRCPHVGQCAFFRAREQLQDATVIVANHDLVLADLALGGGAILPPPEDCFFIFDEGHHLPHKALAHFATFCRLSTTRQWLDESRRALGQASAALGSEPGVADALARLPAVFEGLDVDLVAAQGLLDTVCADIELPTQGRRELTHRFPMGRIPQPLQHHAVGLAERCGQLLMQLERIVGALEDCLAGDLPLIDRDAAERFFPLFGAMLGRAQSLRTLWQDYADERDHDPPRARWIELRADEGRRSYDLHGSPITAAELLSEGLWSRAAGVVVTSATLTALGAFDRFTRFAGVPAGAICERVQSPFAHDRATLHIPAMRSQPGDAVAHTSEVLALLPELLQEDTGALVLFSSRRQMQDVQAGLSPDLRERVLTQGDCSNQELIARHCTAVDSGTQSIIFGLASFAEGIDLPGHYCSHVVIAKIPFAVPDSPLEAAMAEWIEARGGNAFMEISVPDAALRLVQASGRLLRNEGDSGTITILDRRLLQRPYGRAILDSLPPFARRFA